MFTYELALAAVMVTGTAETWVHPETQTWWLPLQQALRSIALEAEILDRRELLMNAEQERTFLHDLKCLQNRHAELQDAPLVEECERFTPRAQIGDYLLVNRSYREHLLKHFALDPLRQEEIRVGIQETQDLYRVWETLYNAQTEYYYVVVRRRDLKTLREKIGSEAFYSGHLPPPLPVWRMPLWN